VPYSAEAAMSFTALLVGIALVGVFQIALIWIIK
jgi:hypothetical protein